MFHKHEIVEVLWNPALTTPVYNGQFRLTERKKSSYIFSTIDLLNTDNMSRRSRVNRIPL